jgi:DoxX-like family
MTTTRVVRFHRPGAGSMMKATNDSPVECLLPRTVALRRQMITSAGSSRSGSIAYWATTLLVAAEALAGGVIDILRVPFFLTIMEHLGYSTYFMVILGVWKILGAMALLVPRFQRLKEWAYAGLIFNFTGAAASHLAVDDGAETVVAPIIFTGLVAAS